MKNPQTSEDKIKAYESEIEGLKNRIYTLEVENRQLRQIREATAKAEPVIRQCHEQEKEKRMARMEQVIRNFLECEHSCVKPEMDVLELASDFDY